MARQSRNSGTDGVRHSITVFNRDWIILAVIVVFFAVLIANLVRITLVEGPANAEKATMSHTSQITLSARRGTIYDRNGEVIASNIEATTIYVNPKEVEQPVNLAGVLTDVLGSSSGMDYDDYYELVTKEDTSFAYIQRKADAKLAQKLKKQLEKAELLGIHYLSDTQRVYPYSDMASQIVGNVDIDGNGIAGLEMQYNELLSGVDGSASIEQGRDGTPISNGVIEETKAQDGQDIVTSIDVKLQDKAERQLLKAVKKYSAQGGSATVMDAKTGEIYASCSYAKSKGKYQLEVGKLAAFTDAYEPGSTFKIPTAVSILKNSSITSKTSFTVPGSLKVYDHTVRDSHEHGTENMTFREIIAESSNIGTVLASRKVKGSQLYKTYTTMGFGKNPGTDFPGTAQGILAKDSEWDGVQAANVTFGQGLMVTGAQLIRAYGAIEQGGTAHVPHFLIDVPNDSEKREEYMSKLAKTKKMTNKSIAKSVSSMMRSVVTSGTGVDAKISGFKVAGKTGTAEVAKSTGGYGNGYIVSFCGWLDGSSSDLVCLVTLTKPKTEEGGGPVCGPVFADIMSFAAERYQVSSNAD